ncbi:MAG TPA: glycosyltransferase family 4 protein [Candidatus Dormibacteraeota bacterium]|nr:glycosyltransferase family 4 protein [Candidatus Dormibacteraeota bacterium]
MSNQRYRVLFIGSHPVQYQAPIFRRFAARTDLDVHIAYCTLQGAEPAHDPDFGVTVQWDVPLLEGYSWSHVPNLGSGSTSFFGLCNPGIWKLIRNGNYDAVVCFTGYVCATFWIACLAAKLSNTAFLFGTDATTLTPRDGRAWKISFKKIFWPRLFRLADQAIAPSSGTRDLMLDLGIPAEHITLVPYSVGNEWWVRQASQVDRSALRSSWGASINDAVILFCAKLQPWKRPLDLLRAFAQAKLSNTILVFAGAGPLRSQLESEAVTLGVSARVRFLGFLNQSQLPAIYTSSDLMVLPSEYEPFAVVVNEAMCCGCPVIASDRVGAARDLIAPVCSQFVFPMGDIDALAAILRKALADRVRLAAIGRAGPIHMQSWSPTQNVAATVDAVRLAVSRMGRRPSRPLSDSTAPHATPTAQDRLHQ